MAVRKGLAAIRWGRSRVGISTAPTSTGTWYRWCKVFVRMCFNVPSDGTPDAGKAWDRAKYKHHEIDPSRIPAGVPVFWELPSVADHVALSTGGGKCLSSDIRRRGRIDEVPIELITRSWGGRLLGWTEDIDGVRVYVPPKGGVAKKPRVSLSALQESARRDPPGPAGHQTHPRMVRLVERALKAEGLLAGRWVSDGSFGSLSVKAYAGWQRRLGYRGKDADGMPGVKSLKELGRRHGFDVVK